MNRPAPVNYSMQALADLATHDRRFPLAADKERSSFRHETQRSADSQLSFINVTLKGLMLLRIVLLGSSLAVALAQPVRAQDGAAIYKSKCATCHGPNGVGDTPAGRSMKVTSLKAASVQKKSDVKLTKIISGGSPKMPAYGKQLSTADIAAVIAFIRTMK